MSVEIKSQYPLRWALSSELGQSVSTRTPIWVSIPSQLGTLFGAVYLTAQGALVLVSIPSQLGTLFGVEFDSDFSSTTTHVSIPSQLGTLFGGMESRNIIWEAVKSQYPRSWALSSEDRHSVEGRRSYKASIPSQLGTLFGENPYKEVMPIHLVSIPSQLGTLFGEKRRFLR